MDIYKHQYIQIYKGYFQTDFEFLKLVVELWKKQEKLFSNFFKMNTSYTTSLQHYIKRQFYHQKNVSERMISKCVKTIARKDNIINN